MERRGPARSMEGHVLDKSNSIQFVQLTGTKAARINHDSALNKIIEALAARTPAATTIS